MINLIKKFSYQEWQRDWPYDARQPFQLELVLNPAKQFLFWKIREGSDLLFLLRSKPLFSGEVFLFGLT
jgi:hypothetical protein